MAEYHPFGNFGKVPHSYGPGYLYVLLCGTILLSMLVSPATAQNPFQEGKKWYDQRAAQADSFRADPTNINRAIEAFKEARKKDIRHEESTAYLLRSYYFKGSYASQNEDRKKEVFEKGRVLGEQAAERYPNSVAIKFWYAANLGKWAKVHGFMASATSGVAKKLRSLSADIIRLDPEYQEGGGYRIKAQVYFYTPDIPLLMSWPSDEKALKAAEKAMKVNDRHPTNRMLYAEILISFDRKEEARKHLEFILEKAVDIGSSVENSYVRYRARQALKEHYGK